MRPRAGLDRDSVVRAAAHLIDQAGADEVLLGDLAAHLGVRTPSLYNHIAGQAGLRRELTLLGLRELAARLGRAAIGRSTEDALVAAAHAYRAFARERPGLYAATLRAPDPGDVARQAASEEVLAVLLAVLASYNLGDEAEVHAVRGLRSLAHGFVSLEIAGGFGLPVDVDESFERLIGMFVAGLRRTVGSTAASLD